MIYPSKMNFCKKSAIHRQNINSNLSFLRLGHSMKVIMIIPRNISVIPPIISIARFIGVNCKVSVDDIIIINYWIKSVVI